jgi:hypothetical protein
MKAPILHGLNTIGIAGRMLLHAIGGSDSDRMRTLEASFAAPAYNGTCGDRDLAMDAAAVH